MVNDVLISVVVDSVPDHPYKARLLLASLLRYGEYSPNQILVNCVDRVDRWVAKEFAQLGCMIHFISPYLDGTICNKLQQYMPPPVPEPERFVGLLMLDLDFALTEKIEIPDYGVVCGKIVDHGNPPLKTFERAFGDMGVTPPSIVTSDWGETETYASNLNGGVIYIPLERIERLGLATREFATSLHSNRAKYDTPGFFIDQVAFALALTSTQTPFKYLSSNDNFPTHHPTAPKNVQPNKPIRAIHYHHDLDRYGFVDPVLKDTRIQGTVDKINRLASDLEGPRIYELFKLGKKRKAIFRKQCLNDKAILLDKKALVLHLRTQSRGGRNPTLRELAKSGPWLKATSGEAAHPDQLAFVPDLTALVQTYGLDLKHIGFDEERGSVEPTVFESTDIFWRWKDGDHSCQKFLQVLGKMYDLHIYFFAPNHRELAGLIILKNFKNKLLRIFNPGKTKPATVFVPHVLIERLDLADFLLGIRETCPLATITLMAEANVQRSLWECLLRQLLARIVDASWKFKKLFIFKTSLLNPSVNNLSFDDLIKKDARLIRYWKDENLQPFDSKFWNP